MTMSILTAEEFERRLAALGSPERREKLQRYFKTGKGEYGEGDEFIGVGMEPIHALANEFEDMTPAEIDKLLDSPIHEVRAGAVCIMNKQARRKRTPESRRKELYELYLRRTDRINNWDLVDGCAPSVVGGYLFDKPRDILYKLARSPSVWERRTAILSTGYFVRQGDVADTFAIAEFLINDDHDLIHKATGWLLRAAGDREPQQLFAFLDQHAATMPRTMLRYAIEHLSPEERTHYLRTKSS